METIVALNSGGFDSTVLMSYLQDVYPDSKLISLFFDYGQRNVEQERICSCATAEYVKAECVEIRLPEMSWIKSELFDKDSHKDYVEYRNLIFLGYAVSLAEARGASKVALALMDTLSENKFPDTTPEFIKGMNLAIKSSKISIIAPFINETKGDLKERAYTYGITDRDMFFSCNTPDEQGNPCGECLDCKSLEDLEEYLKPETAGQAMYCTDSNFDCEDYRKVIQSFPIEEARVLINNDCQLHCKHCYYGFEEMRGEKLTPVEMYYRAIVPSIEQGAKTIHFAGKEPLFDESIFYYARRIQEDYPRVKKIVVTNGITVPKFADRLKETGFDEVLLSSDDLLSSGLVRNVVGVTEKALVALNNVGIPVEMSVDLHQNNYTKVGKILSFAHKMFGVNHFFVRTIHPIGSGKDFEMLSVEQMNNVFVQLMNSEFITDKTYDIRLGIGKGTTYACMDSDLETNPLGDVLRTMRITKAEYAHENLLLLPEFCCNRYSYQVTITPDGYVLGCGMECASPHYDLVSSGNVRYESLKDIIKRGKELNIKGNVLLSGGRDEMSTEQCPFDFIKD